MKIFALILTLLISTTAFAWTEVECSGRNGVATYGVTIDEGFGPGSLRNARVHLQSPEGGDIRRFTVMSRGAFGSRVRYEAAGFQLEVDFWPDARPQWARTYRGTFTSTDMNIPFTNMWCRFPNIRP